MAVVREGAQTTGAHKVSDTISFVTKELFQGIFLKNVHRIRFYSTLLLVLHSAHQFFRANSIHSVDCISFKNLITLNMEEMPF